MKDRKQRKDADVAGRLAKMLQRQTPERSATSEAVAALVRLAEAQPDLRQAAAVQAALIRALYAESALASPYTLGAEEITARLTDGVPLLHNTSLPCTERDMHDMFVRLCGAA